MYFNFAKNSVIDVSSRRPGIAATVAVIVADIKAIREGRSRIRDNIWFVAHFAPNIRNKN